MSYYSETFVRRGIIKSIDEGPEYCKNPRILMEKAQINLNEIIEKVKIQFDDGDKKVKIFPSNQSFWKPSEIRTLGSFRSCHTFLIPESYKRNVAKETLSFT